MSQKPNKHEQVPVFSLLIDLVDSTGNLNRLNTIERDDFLSAFADSIDPFIEELNLNDECFVNYNGDGWIISITNFSKTFELVALAILLQHKFDSKIKEISNINLEKNWSLRFGIAYGLDIKKTIAGRTTFLGDSIRRAKRIASLCKPNEILTGATVNQSIYRDFETTRVDIQKRKQENEVKKFESEIDTVYTVKKIKPGLFNNYPALIHVANEIGETKIILSLIHI